MSEARDKLSALCRSKPELERLLKRLAVVAPIVRQQVSEANRAAERAYYEDSGKPTPEAVEAWRRCGLMHGSDLIEIGYPHGLDTPEWRELRSIGLAVAAFGGSDAISEIGWVVGDVIWHEWDGMANHWL